LLALYRDRLDVVSARSKLGVGAIELEELHQAALAALVECLAPSFSKRANLDAQVTEC
jgi:hypothetical protein